LCDAEPTPEPEPVTPGDGGDPVGEEDIIVLPEPLPELPVECFDSDTCISNTPGWEGYSCDTENAAAYCTSENAQWQAEIKVCCPATCGLCDAEPTEPVTEPEPEVEVLLTYEYKGCFKDDGERDGDYGPMDYGYDIESC
jgi:hypothetical protein